MHSNNIKQLLTAIIIFGLGINADAAKKWVDVTEKYISNPSFTVANYNEWEVSGTARSISARAGCMEMWSGRIDLQKIIENVPNGHYRFSVQALYRTKNHNDAYKEYKDGRENIRGFMFANDKEKPVTSQYSFYFTDNPQYTCYYVDGVYYPNSMEAAETAFNKGAYRNELEFDVTDGNIIIGLYNDESIDDNWLVFDNFKLEQEIDINEAGSGSLLVNEIMSANVDMYMSPAYNFDGWIELYNTTDKELWLGGCFLSDDANNLKKWQMPDNIGTVPANGYKVIWFGSNGIKTNQTPFNLECEGGALYISDSNGNIITRQEYPESRSRLSWARTTDGANRWGWTATPTHGASNSTSVFATKQLDAPVVIPDGKLFSGTMNISVDIPAGTILRYTTDGSTPTLDNGMTSSTGSFTISQTTSYRFRLFQDGILPSPVTTRTYINTTRKFTLPVIAVSTKNEYLYDDMIGVYVKGNNGRTGNGMDTPANWNMDWDRPVNFQYIMPEDNSMAVNQDVAFSISGGWTRANAVKSFKLKADRVYEGLNAMDYPFFTAKPYIKNKTLQVRNGGNDSGSKIKDAALQTIMQRSGINLDLVSYQPAVHFINGEYKGLINVREPNNKDFAYANFGYSKDELDVYEQSPDSGAYMMWGTKDALEALYELSKTSTNQKSYDEIKKLLDIDEYINYMAASLYLGSWDWPDNNVKAYRKKDGGKYRFVVFDLDAAFGTDDRDTDENGNPIYRNTFRWLDGMQWHWYDYIYDEGLRRYGEIKFCTFFFNMLENEDFRRRFIDAFCVVGGSVFDYDRAENILKELGDKVRPTMNEEGGSPDGSLNEIRTKLKGRMEDMAKDMVDYERLRLSDTQPQNVCISSDTYGAGIFINNMEIPYSSFNGKLFAPVKLKAVAPAGYRFAGWKKYSISEETIFSKGSEWKYFTDGSLHQTDWYTSTYNDDSWNTGKAPLGYGKDFISTTLSYGTDANNKRPTYYFRKNIIINNANAESVVMNFTADDGFVVYVNGKEGGRYNLPDGEISYNTYANTANSNPDTGSMHLDAALFRQGENTIAIEVHNNNPNSSDIVWDAELVYSSQKDNDDFYTTSNIMDLPKDENMNIKACFEALTDEDKKNEGITPVMINEISGSNSIYVNDYFERDDWMELYNTTDEDIDIEGMYLSNDINNPLLYQISKGDTQVSTIIPAHGHIVIWCDKENNKTKLHAPFKISADGGELIITSKDKTWQNSLKYPAHNGDETVGRYPDGSQNVYVMNIPTIEKSNIYTSYLVKTDGGETNGITSPDNEVTNRNIELKYIANSLILSSNRDNNVDVRIFTLSGMEVFNKKLSISQGDYRINTSNLQEGCFIAKATDRNGNISSCKFIIARH